MIGRMTNTTITICRAVTLDTGGTMITRMGASGTPTTVTKSASARVGAAASPLVIAEDPIRALAC